MRTSSRDFLLRWRDEFRRCISFAKQRRKFSSSDIVSPLAASYITCTVWPKARYYVSNDAHINYDIISGINVVDIELKITALFSFRRVQFTQTGSHARTHAFTVLGIVICSSLRSSQSHFKVDLPTECLYRSQRYSTTSNYTCPNYRQVTSLL